MGSWTAEQDAVKRRRLFTGTGAPCSNEEATLESVIQNSAADISAEALLEELVAKDKVGGETGPSNFGDSAGPGATTFGGQEKEVITPIPPPPGVDPARWKTVLCMYWQQGACRKARAECPFAHGLEDFAPGARPSQADGRENVPMRVDFSAGLDVNRTSKQYNIPERQVAALMTEVTRSILMDVCGVHDVLMDVQKHKVVVSGTIVQCEKAGMLLQRAATHCHWGVSEAKIQAIIKPRAGSSARCTLSPMVTTLRRFSTTLTPARAVFNIGTDAGNQLVVSGTGLSRVHATLEFVPDRGVVYVMDMSTNGTFLNGRRLPEKGSAKKVIIWHGDELLLMDPSQGGEFGFIVNLEVS
mmetsp:Transcript_31451/g.69339  ORF Transcript_31451/g.69339 Transcript_31451/m.69339 type:complete len:356 (-) Transcript_31451:69-1136(-)